MGMKYGNKRKKLLAGLLTFLLVLTGIPWYEMEVKAETDGDYGYEVNEDRESVTITDYYGSGGDITIPSEIDGKSVTSIGEKAFYWCRSLSNVTIPSSVTSIGEAAFSDCSSLSSVTIPSSVISIGWTSFTGCSNLSDIKVEPGNTTYDSRENCNAIIKTVSNTLIFGCKNTVIPGSVTSIEMNAFAGCSNLSNITIPESVTSIGECAFSGCSSLTSVVIPEGVISIGGYAFSGCSGLTSIVIPESVTSIRNHAFEGSSVVISGKKGSYAQKYALSNNIAFEEIEEKNPSDSQTTAVTVDQKIAAKNFSKTASAKTQSFKLGATASTELTYASDNKNIKVDADGKVTIAKNYAGKATITINAAATSEFNAATAQVTVTVKPAKITASKITATSRKKAVTVKFSKAAGAKSYKVEVATDKKFKKNVKSVTVKTTTATIKGLKLGKKYYVRVTAIGDSSVKSSAVVAKKTVKIK